MHRSFHGTKAGTTKTRRSSHDDHEDLNDRDRNGTTAVMRNERRGYAGINDN
jgi:hypothetical protein